MKAFFTHSDPVVPLHHPRVLVDTAVDQGADRGRLLENTGITEEMLVSAEARISYVQFATLTHNALEQTQNTALGLDFGRRLHLSHMGMLGLAVLSSRSVGEALRLGLRYYRTLAPAWDLELRVDGAHAHLIAREAIPLSPFRVFATEALLAAFEAQARALRGGSIPLVALRLSYSAPPHMSRYAELEGTAVEFDSEVTEAVFEAAILEAPLSSADPLTMSLAERRCAAEAATAASDGLVTQVRRLLEASDPPPAVDEVARALRTSERTLRRSLQAMGTSYLELLDEVRRERAMACARATDLTGGQLAERLGFRDVRAFRRAFKRWTGSSLQDYRRKEQHTSRLRTGAR